MSSDGIAGFKGSLERVFPKTQSQRCVVHLVRNIYSLCPKKQAKEIIADYKKIYTSTSLDDANLHLEMFKNKYEKEQKRIVKKAQDFMEYLEPLFELPQEIRKCIYRDFCNVLEKCREITYFEWKKRPLHVKARQMVLQCFKSQF